MRARDLIPTLVVIALAIIGPAFGDRGTEGRACTTDGPQYTCWLDDD